MIAQILFSRTVRALRWVLGCATLVIVVSGCEKESGPTKVSGQVIEVSTGRPVPNAQVQLRASSPNGRINIAGGGGPNAQGAPHTADAQGNFAFTFEAKKNINYSLLAFRAPYYWGIPGREVDIEGGRANNDVRIPVSAFAWVRYLIVNELPKPPNSIYDLYITGHASGLGISIYQPRDTVIIERVASAYTYKIIWRIRDNQGKETRYDKDILVPPLDTLTLRIPF